MPQNPSVQKSFGQTRLYGTLLTFNLISQFIEIYLYRFNSSLRQELNLSSFAPSQRVRILLMLKKERIDLFLVYFILMQILFLFYFVFTQNSCIRTNTNEKKS